MCQTKDDDVRTDKISRLCARQWNFATRHVILLSLSEVLPVIDCCLGEGHKWCLGVGYLIKKLILWVLTKHLTGFF